MRQRREDLGVPSVAIFQEDAYKKAKKNIFFKYLILSDV